MLCTDKIVISILFSLRNRRAGTTSRTQCSTRLSHIPTDGYLAHYLMVCKHFQKNFFSYVFKGFRDYKALWHKGFALGLGIYNYALLFVINAKTSFFLLIQ